MERSRNGGYAIRLGTCVFRHPLSLRIIGTGLHNAFHAIERNKKYLKEEEEEEEEKTKQTRGGSSLLRHACDKSFIPS